MSFGFFIRFGFPGIGIFNFLPFPLSLTECNYVSPLHPFWLVGTGRVDDEEGDQLVDDELCNRWDYVYDEQELLDEPDPKFQFQPIQFCAGGNGIALFVFNHPVV